MRPAATSTASAAFDPGEAPVEPPGFNAAARYWLKLGFIGFGGPAGQIALMHDELVVRRRWISERRFLHALDYCMLLPGPEAQQLATYMGWLMHRTAGGLLAGALFVLPSLFILIGLSWLYVAQGQLPVVAGIFQGIKPAVTAIVVQAAWRIGRRSLRSAWLAGIAIGACIGLSVFDLPFPLIVLGAGVAGGMAARWAPGAFTGPGGHAAALTVARRRAWIDDDTPAPPHARFDRRRALRVLLACAALWSLAMAGLVAAQGADAVLVQMAWFFTRAAWVTFGGAYAVLPYLVQGAVDQQHWLTATQMIDGLALGETTPGPLIMVVAFVGFVGGWTHTVLGAQAPWLGGVAGAVVATGFTFLPSMLFILVGAPFIESTHRSLRFTAPLAAISAAVVGVIVHLGLFFAVHVLWPEGRAGPFDAAAALIGLVAAAALFSGRVGVIPVVLAAGLVGALRVLV